MSNNLREWATWTIQWDPARNGLKYAVHRFARVRGAALERTGRVPAVSNILAAGPQKAGSQWLKALFDHPIVRSHTGLLTLPQLDYKLTPPKGGFPAGTFVPGFYLSFPEYQALPKPHEHRVVYMSRDPRDMVVSGYWSAVKTHRKTHLPEVEALRVKLRDMSYEDALLEIIRLSTPVLQDMESWIDVEDPTVARFRLEDVAEDSRGQVSAMLEHAGVALPPAELDLLLKDVDRSSLQAKDLAKRKDGDSHYRLNQEGSREVFSKVHHDALDEVAPGLIERLGYPRR